MENPHLICKLMWFLIGINRKRPCYLFSACVVYGDAESWNVHQLPIASEKYARDKNEISRTSSLFLYQKLILQSAHGMNKQTDVNDPARRQSTVQSSHAISHKNSNSSQLAFIQHRLNIMKRILCFAVFLVVGSHFATCFRRKDYMERCPLVGRNSASFWDNKKCWKLAFLTSGGSS